MVETFKTWQELIGYEEYQGPELYGSLKRVRHCL